jgi:hypothetical protein
MPKYSINWVSSLLIARKNDDGELVKGIMRLRHVWLKCGEPLVAIKEDHITSKTQRMALWLPVCRNIGATDIRITWSTSLIFSVRSNWECRLSASLAVSGNSTWMSRMFGSLSKFAMLQRRNTRT